MFLYQAVQRNLGRHQRLAVAAEQRVSREVAAAAAAASTNGRASAAGAAQSPPAANGSAGGDGSKRRNKNKAAREDDFDDDEMQPGELQHHALKGFRRKFVRGPPLVDIAIMAGEPGLLTKVYCQAT